MSIVGCLFRIWAVLTVLAVATAVACFWLVDRLPAAQSADYANIYENAFLIAAPAPILTVPALVVVGLFWGLLRGLSRLVHRSGRLRSSSVSPRRVRGLPRKGSAAHAKPS